MSEREQSEPIVVERRSGGGIGLFLLGVAVGAGLALLYAPQSGAETRQELRRGARRLKRRARVLAEEVQDSAEEVVREARHAVREVARSTRDAAGDAAREAREALERKLARHGRRAADEDEDADA